MVDSKHEELLNKVPNLVREIYPDVKRLIMQRLEEKLGDHDLQVLGPVCHGVSGALLGTSLFISAQLKRECTFHRLDTFARLAGQVASEMYQSLMEEWNTENPEFEIK